MNLLFIQTDQLSANAVGYVGCPYVHTPAINRLAQRSINFRQAHCAYPKCVPNRTAWTYGRMPHEIMLPGTELDYGARPGDPKRGVRPEFQAEEMGHWFRARGYETVYAGKWHVGHWGPTESLEPEFGSGFRALCPINDPMVPEACADFFREHDRSKPFLMVASFDNPHNICEYPGEIALPWGNLPEPPRCSELPPYPGNGYAHPTEPAAIRKLQKSVEDRYAMSPEEWRRYRWAYYRLVEKVDAEIGRILDALDKSGLADSTAVVLTSDHGDMQGAHLLAQKDTFYEESIRVPFLLALPGSRAPVTSDVLVNNALDLYPTLCDLAGIPCPENFHGTSLLPCTDGETIDRPYVAAETKFRFGGGEARMIRSRRYKYVAYDLGPNREQLFDLIADPGEMTNLATCATHAAILEEHRSHLREWLAQTADPFGLTHYAHRGTRNVLPRDEWADS